MRPRTRSLDGWVSRLRHRLIPTYVDWNDIPDDKPSPYRARLTFALDASDDPELQARDVVRGEMRMICEVRCACGKRWFNPKFERVQICPRCDRAVLLEEP